MEIAKNRYGRVSWTLRDGKWVRPETGEVDSSAPTPRDADHYASIGRVVGARPKPGEKPYKPSEDLTRYSANRRAEAKAKEKQERRAKFAQLERDIDTGKVVVDPEATLGTPTVQVRDGERRRIIRADRLDPNEKARIEREQRAEQERIAPPEPEPDFDDRAVPDGTIYSVSEGHDPSLPRPCPKPGAAKHFFESTNLSDLRALPAPMKGAGLG